MLKRKALMLVALAGAVASLAGCGNKKEVTLTAADFEADLTGTTIHFWTPFGSDKQDLIDEMIPEFEKATGINVEVEAKQGYDTLKDAVVESASSTTYPHITFGYPDHFASYVTNDSILRLDEYFELGSHTRYDYAKSEPDFKISDFYDDYMIENQSIEFDENGKGYTLGVPFNKSTEVMVYNETFFNWAVTKDAGIVVPNTWAEFETVSSKIMTLMQDVYGHVVGTDGEIYANAAACIAATGKDALLDFTAVENPLAEGAEQTRAFRPLGRDSTANFFITSIRQWGGTYTTVDQNGKGHMAFDSQETVTALQKMKDYYELGYLGIPSTWAEESYCSNPFKRLNCVMIIGSSAGVTNGTPPGDKFNVKSHAILYKDADKKFVISQGTNICLLNRGDAKERVAAWELLKYLAKYADGYFAAASGYFPSCDYAAKSEDYQAFYTGTPRGSAEKINYETAHVNQDEYIAQGSTWKKFVDASFVGSASLRNSIETVMKQMFIENKTPRQVIDDQYEKNSDYR